MSEVAHTSSYRTYWVAWFVLLILTVAMVSIDSPAVLLLGIIVKATIIGTWFMHLKFERLDLALILTLSVVGFSLVLFALISFDGLDIAGQLP